MWFTRTLVIGLAVLLAGCGLTSPLRRGGGTGSTPEEAVLSSRSTGGALGFTESLEVLGTRDFGTRKIVILRPRAHRAVQHADRTGLPSG